MARKEYKGGAAETTLASSITNVSMSITVDDATNWPTGATGNFWIKIGVGLSTEEKIRCSSRAGNVLTVATGGRGGDGTTAIAHNPPEIVQHVGTAEDFDEANKHINDITVDDHTQYLNPARHDTTARHTIGTVIPVGSSPSASNPGNAALGGVANSVARSDHVHAREAFGSPVASNPGDTMSPGVAGTVARSDHKHAREAAGGGGPTLTYGSPVASGVGDTTADGAATSVARSDHRHARESFGPAVQETGFTTGKVDGVATTVSRSDHKHGIPSMAVVQTAGATGSGDTTTSTSYVDLGSSVTRTIPITGVALVIVGGCVFNTGNNATLISFRASGANTIAASDARAFGVNGAESARGSRVNFLVGLSPGSTTFHVVGRVDGGTGSFVEREITVFPLP